jgi:K+-transporting ATPase ATPase A chain
VVRVTAYGWLQLGLYVAVLLLLTRPLGWYVARVYRGERTGLGFILGPVERLIYRLAGDAARRPMGWRRYTTAMLLFNAAGFGLLYAILRLQGALPLNPQGFGPVAPDLAFNTAISFTTNTNWQNYGGETTLSYLAQMLGLTVQNFLSAATGLAIMAALIRGLASRSGGSLGNFWVDVTRGTLYILLPLALVLALILLSQGVVQTLGDYVSVPLLQADLASHYSVGQQTLAVGPVASQVAIKQLGSNGGGFFNTNSAHPFENPTPLSNFVEMLAILLIPAAVCYTFGRMVGDTRQGWAVLTAMTIMFLAVLGVAVWSEQSGNPVLGALGVDQRAGDWQPGGNMEGKEVRFGIVNSALWATATTAGRPKRPCCRTGRIWSSWISDCPTSTASS